jgi:hypothetical protein
MNGRASRGDEIGTDRPAVVRRYQRFFLGRLNAGRDDERAAVAAIDAKNRRQNQRQCDLAQ